MELTWLAIIASLLMGGGALLIFIYAARRDYFRDLENAKYQVFWCLDDPCGPFVAEHLAVTSLAATGSAATNGTFSEAYGAPHHVGVHSQQVSLGVMLGFLPCGLIYAALIKAMETASRLSGMLTMWAFGLGMMCALLAVGLFSSVFSMRFESMGKSAGGDQHCDVGNVHPAARHHAVDGEHTRPPDCCF